MEHIRQFDWCSSEPDIHFVNEADLDRCVTERILRNKFRDPLVSSDEDETPKKIDWSQVFRHKVKNDEIQHQGMYVPCLRCPPPYPKLSSLTEHQHMQLLKVLCSQNPHMLEAEFVPRPTKQDHKAFQELKQSYEKEQQEYSEWAKTLWTNQHCVRALRPKPDVETVYEAEFKIRANELESFPKNYKVAAQIPLETRGTQCEIVHQKDLNKVNLTELPQIEYPELKRRSTILQPCPTPEPCNKHPCRFVLPNESSMSILPLTEVHRELAQYALDNDARCIASEKALKCLLEVGQTWTLPVSVCESMTPDGDKRRVLVLGSEFYARWEPARARTYRAFKHLLHFALVPSMKRANLANSKCSGNKSPTKEGNGHNSSMESLNVDLDGMDVSSDEEHGLVIDTDDILDTEMNAEPDNNNETSQPINGRRDSSKINNIEAEKDASQPKTVRRESSRNNTIEAEQEACETADEANEITKEIKENPVNDDVTKNGKCEKNAQIKPDDYYSCSCRDSIYARPPPRSFKKWQVRNVSKNEKYDIIVHCAHRVRGKSGELVLEPIPEYQVELGGTKQSEDKIRSLALSLYLRRNASLLNVRIDGPSGDLVAVDNVYYEELVRRHGNQMPDISNTVYTAIDQLQGLLPGHYVIQHEPSHGSNAILYSRCADLGALTLDLQCAALPESDEAQQLKTAPVLAPVLLPMHKFRKILPLAFTPLERFVAKEPKKPVTKQRTPPQAIKWPKKKQNKKKHIER